MEWSDLLSDAVIHGLEADTRLLLHATHAVQKGHEKVILMWWYWLWLLFNNTAPVCIHEIVATMNTKQCLSSRNTSLAVIPSSFASEKLGSIFQR